MAVLGLGYKMLPDRLAVGGNNSSLLSPLAFFGRLECLSDAEFSSAASSASRRLSSSSRFC